jgi:hypothetical protein
LREDTIAMSETTGPVPVLPIQQRRAVAAVTAIGMTLFAYGAAGSYTSISHLAAVHHVPLPGAVPLASTAAWPGRFLGYCADVGRAARLVAAAARPPAAAGTVAANAAAGWPDPVTVGLDVAAPVMILAMVEAAD